MESVIAADKGEVKSKDLKKSSKEKVLLLSEEE
jgi:hypothetical protein